MTCDKYSPLLSLWMDGEIPHPMAADVGEHLEECRACREKIEAWRAQSAAMRAFFRKRALQESFVEKIRRSNESRLTPEPSSTERGWLGSDVFTWLQAAAAILIVVFLVTQVFRPVEGLALGRVLDAGERLEVRAAHSAAWSAAERGATLRQGDWLRTPRQGKARIELTDSSTVTLLPGALARMEASDRGSGARVVMMRGALASMSSGASSGLEVRSAAGTLLARDADFDLRLHDVSVAEFRAGRYTRGVVQAVAGVKVLRGQLQGEGGRSRGLLRAGETHYLFSDERAGSAAVADELRLHSGTSGSDSGAILSSFEISEKGLKIRLTIDGAPLSRVLECVFKSRVRGDASTLVSGAWSYPVEADPSTLAEDFGEVLGARITLRSEKSTRETARFAEPEVADWTAPSDRSYEVELLDDGLISYRFEGVPAGVVFHSLRMHGIDLPDLAPEDDWRPVTTLAQRVNVADVPTRIERDLRLEIEEVERSESWVEWRTVAKVSDSGSEGAEIDVHRSTARPTAAEAPHLPNVEVGDLEVSRPEPGDLLTPIPLRSSRSTSHVGATTIWNVLFGSIQGAHGASNASTLTKTTMLTSGSDVGSGDSSDIRREFKGPRSRHFVWPVRSSEQSGSEYYRLYNPGGSSATAVWYGYDASGFLLWVREIEMPADSEAVIVPRIDFGANESGGGHWESRSNVPLAALFMRRQGSAYAAHAVASAVSASPVITYEELLLSGLGGESRPWLVNHGEVAARIRFSVMEGSETLLLREMILAPHASWRWSAGEELGGSAWRIGRHGTRYRIVIQSTSRAVTAGIHAR